MFTLLVKSVGNKCLLLQMEKAPHQPLKALVLWPMVRTHFTFCWFTQLYFLLFYSFLHFSLDPPWGFNLRMNWISYLIFFHCQVLAGGRDTKSKPIQTLITPSWLAGLASNSLSLLFIILIYLLNLPDRV